MMPRPWILVRWVMIAWLLQAANVLAQPAGWSHASEVAVFNPNASALSEQQLRLSIDTQSLIAAGTLRADAGDLRFGTDAAGSTLVPYWIAGGVNTTETEVWVRLPLLPANAVHRFFVFHGNAAAVDAGTTDVFDFDSEHENSATLQVDNGSPGGVTNSQRGFRFVPNEDLLLVALGKREPNGTTRTVTLFDVETQAKLEQMQVSGPAAMYSYTPLPAPRMLRAGHTYSLILFQGDSDGYYFGSSTQINPRITYLRMDYCNSCTADTFPQNFLNAIHYGYPDFLFRSAKQPPLPLRVLTTPLATSVAVAASANVVDYRQTVLVTASIDPLVGALGTIDVLVDDVTVCNDVPVIASTASCTVSAEPVGQREIRVRYNSGDPLILASEGVLTIQVDPTLPGVPRNPWALTEPGAAWIDVEPPENTGGLTIRGYFVYCTDGQYDFGALGATPPLRVAGLTDGTTYGCEVSARNNLGQGPATPIFLVTPPLNRIFIDGFELPPAG